MSMLKNVNLINICQFMIIASYCMTHFAEPSACVGFLMTLLNLDITIF